MFILVISYRFNLPNRQPVQYVLNHIDYGQFEMSRGAYMTNWQIIRFFNLIIGLLPAGAIFNPFLLFALDAEELVNMTFNFFGYSKVVFIAYLISESALFISREYQNYNTIKYFKYFILLPIITVACSPIYVGKDYIDLLPIYFLSFFLSPIAWGFYFIIYLLYKFYRVLNNS